MIITGRSQVADQEENALTTLGLSTNFDSSEATMRLAALTNGPEEVDELSKTLKIMKPQIIKQPVPKARPAVPPRTASVAPTKKSAGKFKILILLMAVLALAVAIYIK
jgi:hypothetical protein